MKKEELKQIHNCPGIYCIKNNINNLCYIGQSIKLRHRLYDHFRVKLNSKHAEYPLYRDILKYQINNFSVEILEYIKEPLTIEELSIKLDNLEIEYIAKYDSYKNGYNQTRGGKSGISGYHLNTEQRNKIRKTAIEQARDGRYILYCLDLETNNVFKYLNASIAAEELSLSTGAIRNAKSKKEVLSKYYFSSNPDELINIDIEGKLCNINSIQSIFKWKISHQNKLKNLDRLQVEVCLIVNKLYKSFRHLRKLLSI